MIGYMVMATIISVLVNILVGKIRDYFQYWRITGRGLQEYQRNHSNGSQINHQPIDARPPTRHSQPVNNSTPANTTTRNMTNPPELPPHRGTRINQHGNNNVRRSLDDFPACSICRCKNRPGSRQMVFWDSNRNMWRCHNNHYFYS